MICSTRLRGPVIGRLKLWLSAIGLERSRWCCLPVMTVRPVSQPSGTTLGCRIPACEQTRALLQISGPLATTSANRSGEPASTTAAEAALVFPDVAQLGPQPWPQPSGQASTVLVWVEEGRWRLVRRGAVIPAGVEVLE